MSTSPADLTGLHDFDSAGLHAQYNNRALVPEHGLHLTHWAITSAAVRRQQPCDLDVAYGQHPSERLDIFPATSHGEGLAPVVVFLHGGYWRSLDKADHSFIAPAFTALGACVVVPNYALCPAVTVAHIGQQMLQALLWVQGHIQAWQGDAQRVVLVGHSAGGQLAAWLLSRSPALAQSAVAISGLFDLEPLRHTPFLQEALHLTPEQVLSCSPIHQPPPTGRPLWAVVGGDESGEFHRQNQLIQTIWGQAAVPQARALPGLNHFSILDTLAQPGTALHALVQGALNGSTSAANPVL
jgi:arylformamidase